MSFAWPWMLLSLLLVPLLARGYRRLAAGRGSRRARLAEAGLVASEPGGRWRHLAPALFLGALAVLCVALARPEATVAEPRREGTVVLAFDTSASMRATDLTPNRMQAAKDAARAFVERQPSGIRIGVVAFGGQGLITQQPTLDRAQALAAIDRLTPQGGTALARGIQTSLSAIAGRTVQLEEPAEGGDAGQDVGYFGSAAVVLLSDGENTDGPDPLVAADLASTAGVKVYPVGLGSPEGTVLDLDGFQVATALDEQTLRQIAGTTDGDYYAAADSAALRDVYSSIDLEWTARAEQREVTSLFALVAVLLLTAGAAVSLVRTGRVI